MLESLFSCHRGVKRLCNSFNSAISVEDDRLTSISDTANFTISDVIPKAVLNGGDLYRSHDLLAPISGNTCAQGASVPELNHEILDQSAEKFGILASAATQARLSCKEGDDHSTTRHESAAGIDSEEALPRSDTKASSTKRSLLDSNGPGDFGEGIPKVPVQKSD
ncbi:hypothetical protein B0T10DRAFT_468049 [Thelonectria olida]|uniref:Uncharacterized protein n=1 Tax=Thelonectria olida TaxID=1576542 RepID=A0A9P8VNF5_9HYPO|nr:hypothetical protein B0T10DRAFT_468049 [Thelonectria olida]